MYCKANIVEIFEAFTNMKPFHSLAIIPTDILCQYVQNKANNSSPSSILVLVWIM